RAIDLLRRHGPVEGARVLMVGVAYKPGVADLRESPALEIIGRLVTAGANVSYVDDRFATIEIAGVRVERVTRPQERRWDLVIVRSVPPPPELPWRRAQPLVLDTTYRLSDLPGRELP